MIKFIICVYYKILYINYVQKKNKTVNLIRTQKKSMIIHFRIETKYNSSISKLANVFALKRKSAHILRVI